MTYSQTRIYTTYNNISEVVMHNLIIRDTVDLLTNHDASFNATSHLFLHACANWQRKTRPLTLQIQSFRQCKKMQIFSVCMRVNH